MKRDESWNNNSGQSDKDDSWWQSLLSEKVRGTSSKPQNRKRKRNQKSDEQALNWVDWTRILELQEKESLCYAEVIGFNRGGLLVRAQEFQGFVPRSHLVEAKRLTANAEAFLEEYMGEELELKVIEVDPERGRIVLSERAAKSEPGARQLLLESLKEGKLVDGKVTNVTPFGLFLDLGGVEGLIHISELSWGRVGHPREVANIGDQLAVVVLEMDEEKGRVSLSLKKGIPNPWNEAADRYPLGTQIDVEISEVVHYGAFAKIENGLEGLIHISQMGIHERLDPRLVFERGMQVVVQVIEVEIRRQRISLQLIETDKSEGRDSEPKWMGGENS